MQPSERGVLREDLLLKVRAGSLVPREALLNELRSRRDLHAQGLAIYRDIQQRLLYLPLLRGLMFETDNVAWCDAAIELLQE